MTHLREVDDVAYVRFASVYRSFRDIDEFRDRARQARDRTDAASQRGESLDRDGREAAPTTPPDDDERGWTLALELGARRRARRRTRTSARSS